MDAEPQSPEEFFAGSPAGLAICLAVQTVVGSLGPATIKTSKSQVAFWRQHGFAYVWRPGQYLKSGVPAVLSIVLHRQATSPRFKEVAHPAKSVWVHHIELNQPNQVDDEVEQWLKEAYRDAGSAQPQ